MYTFQRLTCQWQEVERSAILNVLFVGATQSRHCPEAFLGIQTQIVVHAVTAAKSGLLNMNCGYPLHQARINDKLNALSIHYVS